IKCLGCIMAIDALSPSAVKRFAPSGGGITCPLIMIIAPLTILPISKPAITAKMFFTTDFILFNLARFVFRLVVRSHQTSDEIKVDFFQFCKSDATFSGAVIFEIFGVFFHNVKFHDVNSDEKFLAGKSNLDYVIFQVAWSAVKHLFAI